ncbi:MAG: squalene--hopene cyclase [Phycisphaerae bacterium]|nr:squalene--hopene cyclase [Phycisphaerae bacterium]
MNTQLSPNTDEFIDTARVFPGRRGTGGLAARAGGCLAAAVGALFGKQHADGHWCAELEGDSILNSEYLLMKVILGQEGEASRADEFARMCVYLRMLQREDGTWGQYPGSPPDLSAMVKAYFALKLWGDRVDSSHMTRAREAILRLGGAERINTFSMFYLACLGQVSWDACPVIPPEVVLLPRWFPFHLDKVAAWTRTMILPLALCTALRPVRALEASRGISELFIDRRKRAFLSKEWDGNDPTSWTNIFLSIDRAMKHARRMGLIPRGSRAHAIREAEKWLLARMTPETTDGLGAIFPPMVYIQVAFRALGYERDHPVIVEAERQLDRFIVAGSGAGEDGGGSEEPGGASGTPAPQGGGEKTGDTSGEAGHVRIQPCFSPVWDTGIALYALTEAGLTAEIDARLARTCEWLLAREVCHVGDWVRNLRPEDRPARMGPGTEHGAWAFEYRNDWYPDVDDTAMVCKSLWRAAGFGADGSPVAFSASGNPSRGAAGRGRAFREAARRGVKWMLAMQNDDGGWAAFDRTVHREWMEHVPFADHNAMQDPSCADITGRTIEALVTCGVSRHHPSVRRAVAYLKREQRPEGCWWGRWGCNFLYGTWQAVGGLTAAGEDSSSGYLRRALRWLRSVQNADGGFGESANSYLDERLMGMGPSTASQTAWGVTAMMYLAGTDDPAVERAIEWLCETQLRADLPARAPEFLHDEPAGSWSERWFTGTGFPKVFYLRYHLYRHYFPVMALGRYLRLRQGRAFITDAAGPGVMGTPAAPAAGERDREWADGIELRHETRSDSCGVAGFRR